MRSKRLSILVPCLLIAIVLYSFFSTLIIDMKALPLSRHHGQPSP